jgi:hypothetical protein
MSVVPVSAMDWKLFSTTEPSPTRYSVTVNSQYPRDVLTSTYRNGLTYFCSSTKLKSNEPVSIFFRLTVNSGAVRQDLTFSNHVFCFLGLTSIHVAESKTQDTMAGFSAERWGNGCGCLNSLAGECHPTNCRIICVHHSRSSTAIGIRDSPVKPLKKLPSSICLRKKPTVSVLARPRWEFSECGAFLTHRFPDPVSIFKFSVCPPTSTGDRYSTSFFCPWSSLEAELSTLSKAVAVVRVRNTTVDVQIGNMVPAMLPLSYQLPHQNAKVSLLLGVYVNSLLCDSSVLLTMRRNPE